MKNKQSHSDLDDREYIGPMLFVMGMFAVGASLAQACPALSHIASKLISYVISVTQAGGPQTPVFLCATGDYTR